MNGITYIENFIQQPEVLFNFLKHNIIWDDRMSARKTASFGQAYNYSQIVYSYQPFIKEIEEVINQIEKTLHFKPNNCLINYYLDGKSRMGFHSDQTDILVENTGVGIVSIGETRILRFRNIENKEVIKDFKLPSGSIIYMTNEVQDEWQHAIPISDTENERMSLTFRKIKNRHET